MNSIILLGNITKDPEVREGKVKAASTAIAVRRAKEDTDFFSIVGFGVTAEFMKKYLKKGSKVCIRGNLKMNNYTNKEGVKVTGYQVIAESIEFA